jgi:hypothetical protein
MKRSAISFAGFVFGLFLTWLSLYVGSHVDWHRGLRAGGCVDRDDCSWWVAPLFIGYILLAPILFAVLNGVAWKRWKLRRWAGSFAALCLLTVAGHMASYVMPR